MTTPPTSEEVEVNVRHIDDEDDPPPPLPEMIRRLVLAGIGVVALTYDEIEQLVRRLVERGEIAQKDGEKILREMTTRMNLVKPAAEESAETEPTESSAPTIPATIEHGIEQLLNRLNVPSKRDIDELNLRIGQLSARIEELHHTGAPKSSTATKDN